MALQSPGVEVSVIDESFYTPAAPGTVPLLFVATSENKSNGSGTGIAPGTIKSNAGRPYLITSQRELVETFGEPIFYTDQNNNPIHGGELNEYGLQTAYSLLGVSNSAYIVRADLDLGKLKASATPPSGLPTANTVWLDTANTRFGIFEWDQDEQSFTNKVPLIITDTTRVVDFVGGDYTPKQSIGVPGNYAIVAVTNLLKLWYRNTQGTWVEVGSGNWTKSWYTVRGSRVNPTLTTSKTISINGITITTGISTTTLAGLAQLINVNSDLVNLGISAGVVSGSLELYSTGVDITVAAGSDTVLITEVGLTAGTYRAPKLQISPHTDVPEYKTADENRPNGSLWIKTTSPNLGANWSTKRWNATTQLWDIVAAPLYENGHSAIYSLDRAGGGINIPRNTIYVKYNVEEDSNQIATFKTFNRVNTGDTMVTSAIITNQLSAGTYEFNIRESNPGTRDLLAAKTVQFTVTGNAEDADVIASAINNANFNNIEAEVNAQNRLVIKHTTGGDFRLADTDGALATIGFSAYVDENTGTPNLYSIPAGEDSTNDFIASNWNYLDYTASAIEPVTTPVNGELWYNSIVDEVDILIHDGTDWVGYQNYNSSYANTNPTGPIVAASQPVEQSDGSALVDGDLWIDTSDIRNYPTIYRWNGVSARWVLIDKTDQTTTDGIIFADARYNTSGENSETAGSIVDLLTSDYVDPDAPDPALYPKGMLLWNLRRSGFNVKRFERNYIDVDGLNTRENDASMANYYPHRWVTASPNNEDGSGSFGELAQRKTVVTALQGEVNSNQDIRDDESRIFNLMACPGYPELIGELITLNYDRGLTAFIVGDSPMRLRPNATDLNEWARNVRNAVEDNDQGLVSSDEYLGIYYPAGFTSDNFGNNIVMPSSYMALRTILLNDQVAYPWFAPAGLRRGGVTNATSSGYINDEGEFVSVALNEGIRDVLYSNNINPITFLSGSGLVVYGQKTRARAASALDRINVARLVVYLRRQLELLGRPYLFEPNDRITREQIQSAAESLLNELVGLRAIYDFLVVCDTSNNTPARIDRNELWLDIAIEPTKAVEFIYIPLRIKNTGEIASLG